MQQSRPRSSYRYSCRLSSAPLFEHNTFLAGLSQLAALYSVSTQLHLKTRPPVWYVDVTYVSVCVCVCECETWNARGRHWLLLLIFKGSAVGLFLSVRVVYSTSDCTSCGGKPSHLSLFFHHSLVFLLASFTVTFPLVIIHYNFSFSYHLL